MTNVSFLRDSIFLDEIEQAADWIRAWFSDVASCNVRIGRYFDI